MGLGTFSSCALCGHTTEDLAHVLLDCSFAKNIWMLILPEQLKQSLNPVAFSDDSWVSLHSDGAVVRDSGYAASGGVARDKEGNWIVGGIWDYYPQKDPTYHEDRRKVENQTYSTSSKFSSRPSRQNRSKLEVQSPCLH
ncbi:hypothetical protein PVK06_008186 [Gossypium arboreum]|uniref:Reverse transcriptase zinc-binding domain-containing protein n=1 Tax=Gossypium arboreum TaxID=29729 RepID=A0ABR0QK65_GOSAR|nr:hypothetical protein PVK06_008186 [Gossypium arboreum]